MINMSDVVSALSLLGRQRSQCAAKIHWFTFFGTTEEVMITHRIYNTGEVYMKCARTRRIYKSCIIHSLDVLTDVGSL